MTAYWSAADLADLIEAGLKRRKEADDLEQTVYGFDSLDELGLHPLIQEALAEGGYGVWPEQRYPDDRKRKRKNEGRRCDIVLTPDGLPLRDPAICGTLFDDQPAVNDEEAYWLEIKTVAQFESGGPFRRYASELLSTVTEDVKKIFQDSQICHGGLLLVLFTQTPEVAAHDIQVWHQRAIDRGYPAAPPVTRGLAITDRVGNAWCEIALSTVRGG